jgi:uncharacterized membrane protein YdjX (TVP38/TMEM64 family)
LALDRRIVRLLILGVVLVGLIVVRYTTGIGGELSVAHIRELTLHAGAWGVLLFVAAFAVGELLHVPGLAFVVAAVMVWGRLTGGLVALLGAVVSVSFSFAVVRAIGGQPLGTIRNARIRAILARIDRHPITTVTLLRLLLFLLPAVNYALALSSVRFRDYLVGSALGLAVPVSVASALAGFVFH